MEASLPIIKTGGDPNDPSGFILSAFYHMRRLRLFSVSITILPPLNGNSDGHPGDKARLFSQRSLRLIADGEFGLPFCGAYPAMWLDTTTTNVINSTH